MEPYSKSAGLASSTNVVKGCTLKKDGALPLPHARQRSLDGGHLDSQGCALLSLMVAGWCGVIDYGSDASRHGGALEHVKSRVNI